MTFAPGKTDWGITGPWERDLEADLSRMRAVFHASMLVSLIEPHERTALKIQDLLQSAERVGFDVVPFPFEDGSVPESLQACAQLVHRILGAARDGANVVIHCRGGLGRTGLVAACCVAAVGHSAASAIALVRRVRSHTIETPAQEQFVRDFASRCDPARRPPSRSLLSRFRGCLLGGAIGDALGYPIEFESSPPLGPPERLERAPSGKALISDDTQMTLFVTEGIVRARQRQRQGQDAGLVGCIQRALLRWYATQEPSAAGAIAPPHGWLFGQRRLHHRRAPGSTCLASLSAQLRGEPMPTVGSPANDSKGCGAVMRSAPIGLAAGSREQAFELARDAAVVTHGHPGGYLSAAYFASLVFDLSRQLPLLEAIEHADQRLAHEKHHEPVRDAVAAARRVPDAASMSRSFVESLGGGWVGEQALSIALACCLTSGSDPRHALWRAVAHSGDSDSTGAVAGNLLGAMHGLEALPQPWLDDLELRSEIDWIARDLYASAVLGCWLDDESYPPE
jgi:ADP-ribosyl-[dinitrogen reductase] hydrolase